MPSASGWDVYYVVLLSAVFALSLPFALRLVSTLISSKAPTGKAENAPRKLESPMALGRRINSRFFLAANAALILITFGFILIPCVGMVRLEDGKKEALGGLISILSLVGLASLGLLYSARKGDLNWLRSSREKRGD